MKFIPVVKIVCIILIYARSQEKLVASGTIVHPQVFENRGSNSEKVLVIREGHSLKLQKASVLVDRVLFRDVTDTGVIDRYIDGRYYERHLYKDSENEASLLVQPQADGDYHIVGTINGTHSIEPVSIRGRSLSGRTPHKLSAIPMYRGNHDSIRTRRSKYGRSIVRYNNAKLDLPRNFTIETFFLSDVYHTQNFTTETDLINYAILFMLAVGLRLQQLNPPGFIAVTGVQATRTLQEENLYVSLLNRNVILGSETLDLLARYAIFNYPMLRSDAIILATGRLLLKESGKEIVDALGLAHIGAACGHHKGAIVRDEPHTYSGVSTAIHEFGHLLGCNHDGEEDSALCQKNGGYIMQPRAMGNKRYKFSTCSQIAINKFLRLQKSSCLRSYDYNPKSILPNDTLTTGPVIDGNNFCARYFPNYKNVSLSKATENCIFRCNLGNPTDSIQHADVFAPDGTRCDTEDVRKKCKYGFCMPSRQ
uniref:Reprolysin n=1 Tax=Rhipicephalus zambeziensis TaxID=60191 RepID=A0A224YGG4_9ACAR